MENTLKNDPSYLATMAIGGTKRLGYIDGQIEEHQLMTQDMVI